MNDIRLPIDQNSDEATAWKVRLASEKAWVFYAAPA